MRPKNLNNESYNNSNRSKNSNRSRNSIDIDLDSLYINDSFKSSHIENLNKHFIFSLNFIKFKEDNLSIEKPADFTIEKHKNNESKYQNKSTLNLNLENEEYSNDNNNNNNFFGSNSHTYKSFSDKNLYNYNNNSSDKFSFGNSEISNNSNENLSNRNRSMRNIEVKLDNSGDFEFIRKESYRGNAYELSYNQNFSENLNKFDSQNKKKIIANYL